MAKNLFTEGRLDYLDAIRGIASLLVACFYHYQHLSSLFQPNSAGHIPPFYSFLPFRFFFSGGDLMVDVFFFMSGIVFAYNYRVGIQNRTVSAFSFFSRRFSRLYPIHLLTLLITLVIVYPFYHYFKTYPLYQNNDVFHFILNLLFMQRGWLDKGYSFNGPAWSLSIEMIMYALFFLESKYTKILLSSIFLILIGIVFFMSPIQIRFLLNVDVARGLIGFFCGSLMYELLLRRRSIYTKSTPIIIGIFYAIYLIWFTIKVPSQFQLIGVLVIIFPYLHYSKLIQSVCKNRLLKFFGDISLAVYLIHVPIQMLIIFWFRATQTIIPYDKPTLFLAYSALVIMLGYVLHYHFERPIQRYIRNRLSKLHVTG